MNEYQLVLVGGWIQTLYSVNLPTHLRIDLGKGIWPKDDMTGEFFNPALIAKVKFIKFHAKKPS